MTSIQVRQVDHGSAMFEDNLLTKMNLNKSDDNQRPLEKKTTEFYHLLKICKYFESKKRGIGY